MASVAGAVEPSGSIEEAGWATVETSVGTAVVGLSLGIAGPADPFVRKVPQVTLMRALLVVREEFQRSAPCQLVRLLVLQLL